MILRVTQIDKWIEKKEHISFFFESAANYKGIFIESLRKLKQRRDLKPKSTEAAQHVPI